MSRGSYAATCAWIASSTSSRTPARSCASNTTGETRTTALDAHLLLGRLQRCSTRSASSRCTTRDDTAMTALLFRLQPAAGGPPTSLDMLLIGDTMTGVDLALIPPGGPVEAGLRGTGSLELGGGVRIDPPARLTAVAAADCRRRTDAVVRARRAGGGRVDAPARKARRHADDRHRSASVGHGARFAPAPAAARRRRTSAPRRALSTGNSWSRSAARTASSHRTCRRRRRSTSTSPRAGPRPTA